MNYAAAFYPEFVVGILLALPLYGIPGALVARNLGLVQRWCNALCWLVAPGLGLLTFGPFSHLICYYLGYNRLTLALAWMVFLALNLAYLSATKPRAHRQPGFSASAIAGIVLACALAATLLHLQLFPLLYADGLYFGVHIFDQTRTAMIATAAREGLPLVDPYFSNGTAQPLVYYYHWHFNAAHLCLLGGLTAYPSGIALGWFSAFSIVGMTAYLALTLARRPAAGFVAVLLCCLARPVTALAYALAMFGSRFLLPADGNATNLLPLQMGYAPQHVTAAFGAVVLLFLAARCLGRKCDLLAHAVCMSLIASFVFGCSVWVCIGLAILAPALVAGALVICYQFGRLTRMFRLGVSLIVLTPLFAAPMLQTMAARAAGPNRSMGLWVQPVTQFWQDRRLAQVVLYWAQQLPLLLGIILFAGLATLWLRRSMSCEQRLWKCFSVLGVLGTLVGAQFLRSTIIWNDFGWRVVTIATLLLTVWSAVGLSDLFLGSGTMQAWVCWPASARWAAGARVAAGVLIVLGALDIFHALRTPMVPFPEQQDSERLAAHRVFHHEVRAWEVARRFAGPDELVQCNPEGIRGFQPFPVNLSWAMFADRRTAFADRQYGIISAMLHGEDFQRNFDRIVRVFSATPDPDAVHFLAEQLHVKVVVVSRVDGAWDSDTIAATGLYRLVHEEPDAFKIYCRTSPDNPRSDWAGR
jgi:hypothetical protein